MSNLDKTITFDTVRFVTYSEYISDVNDEFFDNDIDLASGEARKVEFHSRKHTDIIPFQLYIRVNYKSKRMTIEFSSKILFKDYPLLISAQTFRQCLLNIENLNICKLDIDKIIENCYFNKLHITKDVDLKLTSEILDRLNQYNGEYRRYKWHRYTDGILFTKDVKAVDCRESITIYNKEAEISLYRNKTFLRQTGAEQSILNYFEGKTRFEIKLENKRKIMKELEISNTDFHSVMNTNKNILLSLFNKIFDTDTSHKSNTIQINNIVDYGLWCIIRYHKFDLRSIEQEIKDISLYSNKTKGALGKQMKKIKAMMQTFLNQEHNADSILSQIRDKIKN